MFHVEPDTALPESVLYIEPEYVLTGPEFDPETYYGIGTAARVDARGRRWVLEDVDLVAAAEKHATRTAAQSALDADPPVLVEAPPAESSLEGIEFNPTSGTVHELELTSWTKTSCSGSTQFWTHDQNGAMVESGDIDASSPKRAVVWFTSTGGPDCTGTVVLGDDLGNVTTSAILTAAHCVTDVAGDELDPNTFTVCTLENLARNTEGVSAPTCFGVEEVIKAANWIGPIPTYEVEQDYALLIIDDDPKIGLSGGLTMDAAASDTFGNKTDYHRGYSTLRAAPLCDPNEITDPALLADSNHNGRHMYQASGDVQGTPAWGVKWDTSTCKGCSGGSHFFCPTGNCDDAAVVSGIQTAKNLCNNANCASGHVYGPKMRNFTAAIIDDIPVTACPGLDEAGTGPWGCDCPLWEDTLVCKWDHSERWERSEQDFRYAQNNPTPATTEDIGDYQLVLLEQEGVRCADGTMPAIWVDPAVDEHGVPIASDKWILSLVGGGTCAPLDADGDDELDLLAESPGTEYGPYCGPCYAENGGGDCNAADPENDVPRAHLSTNGLDMTQDDFAQGIMKPCRPGEACDNVYFAGYNRIRVEKCHSDRYIGNVRWEANGGALDYLAQDAGGDTQTTVNFYQQGFDELLLVLDSLKDGLQYVEYFGEPGQVVQVRNAQLPPLKDAEQVIFVGHSGGASGLPFVIDGLRSIMLGWSVDAPSTMDVRVLLDAFWPHAVENEVNAAQDLVPGYWAGSTCGLGMGLCDAYDHYWAGESLAQYTPPFPVAGTGFQYTYPTVADYFLNSPQASRLTTWGVLFDTSCLDAHPVTGGAPAPTECRNLVHVTMNHIATPMFIKQDISDPTIGLITDFDDDGLTDLPWAECLPGSPGCVASSPPPEIVFPEEYQPRLVDQAMTFYLELGHRSEFIGSPPVDTSFQGSGSPAVYGFFPACFGGGPTHQGCYDTTYWQNVEVSFLGVTHTYREWAELWAADPVIAGSYPLGYQRFLIDPTTGGFTQPGSNTDGCP